MQRIRVIGLMLLGTLLGAGAVAAQGLQPVPTGQKGDRLATIELGKAYPVMKGYQLKFSRITVPPGGGLTKHSHKELPEVQIIISGVLTDQRNGGPPHAFGPGSILVNDADVTHATINMGKVPVVLYSSNVSKPPATP
jgi:quercetin dioxygenase-like cupin family protein